METSVLRQALLKLNMSADHMDTFVGFLEKYACDPSPKISNWEAISSPEEKNLSRYNSLETPDSYSTQKALSRFAMCKLNGGLGTGMGCAGSKSSIVVRQGKTFLDLIVEQLGEVGEAYGVEIPLILMNSFYTHGDTQKILDKFSQDLPIHCFQQNRFPRLDKESGLPLDEKVFGVEAWYPPGHGDIYGCLSKLGWLDRLLDQGKEILFVSNADNLGATADTKILCHMLANDIPFLMEMTEKTAADVKGGTLYQENGRLRLLEIAQVPDEHLDEFASDLKFKLFNTNNIWINLVHLKKRLEQGPMGMGVIANEKYVAGRKVIQLETAIGSALDQFSGAVGLTVGRDRFLPVKKTSDLMIAQSNLFVFENGRPIRNSDRTLDNLPNIILGNEFNNLEDYLRRIPDPPGMLELEKLRIEGNVALEPDITMKGNVSIIGRENGLIVPRGSILENVTLEG